MALGPRLDIRQTQSLVMTPQLQQAIKLLAASNLEIETFIAEALMITSPSRSTAKSWSPVSMPWCTVRRATRSR
jgi:hypothetical protein